MRASPTKNLHSRTTLERFKELLTESKEQHQLQLLPKRVLNVGTKNSQMVFLEEFTDVSPNGLYICLSHRWSHSSPLITTKMTLKERMSDIKFSDLSTTLQDATRLAQGLDVQYLWIDSLCILQDSTQDWEVESAKMGSYYSKGWLTLAAGFENGSQSGFFGVREIEEATSY